VYRIKGTNEFVSFGLKDNYDTDELHVDVNFVDGIELDTAAFSNWKPDYANASFILEEGKYLCGVEVEKMSKSKFNTVNPDDLVLKYGADTFRMYEMFLGPIEQSKPWDTKGIEGVHRFLRKLWRLFNDDIKGKVWTTEKATEAELKILHKAIKKIESDTDQFSFNTAVSAFMVCVNELTDLKCNKKEILENMLILLTPFAPHISEELWSQIGNNGSILDARYPHFEGKYLLETSKEYPVSINGKLRTAISISLEASQSEAEEIVLANDIVRKWLEGAPPKKIIFVKGKMINVVV
jgi:leucyl-tRNA synthetase